MPRPRGLASVIGVVAMLAAALVIGTTATASTAGALTDSTPPVITIAVDPASPDGNNGWYVSPVHVTLTATDPDSSITDTTGCGSTQQSSNTPATGHTFTCQATSAGGTSSKSVTIRLDTTPPFVSVVGLRPSPILLHGPLHADIGALDGSSGIATKRCSNLSTAVWGGRTTTCRATDKAGNTGSFASPVHYTVEYVMRLGIFGTWRVNKPVSIAVRLSDAAGHAISDAAAAKVGCHLKFSLTGAQTRSTCLHYRASTNQFRYAWKLGRRAGRVTLHVTLTYPNSTVKRSISTTMTIKR